MPPKRHKRFNSADNLWDDVTRLKQCISQAIAKISSKSNQDCPPNSNVIVTFLQELLNCNNVSEILVVVRRSKASLRQAFVGENYSTASKEARESYSALMFVIIHPNSSILKKSLEFVFEYYHSNLYNSSIATDVMAEVIENCNELVQSIDFSDSNVSIVQLQEWCSSLNFSASVCRKSLSLSSNGLLLNFLICVENILAALSSVNEKRGELENVSNISNAKSEIFQSISNTLQIIDKSVVKVNESERIILGRVLHLYIWPFLQIPNTKETILSAAICAATAHWVANFSSTQVDEVEMWCEQFIKCLSSILVGDDAPSRLLFSEFMIDIPLVSIAYLLKAVLCVCGHLFRGNVSFLLANIPEVVTHLCNHNSPEIRIAGIELLETWLDRIELEVDDKISSSNANELSLLVSTLTVPVTLSWTHHIRQLNHLVPVIFERMVSLAALIHSFRPNVVNWENWIKRAMQLSSPLHRSRYQALNIILKKAGFENVSIAHPDLLTSLVEVIRNREVAPSASGIIVTLVRASVEHSVSLSWEGPISESLCSFDEKQRLYSADYLLPELLKINPKICGEKLVTTIRQSNYLQEGKLWGLVNICLQCRLLGLSYPIIDTSDTDKGNLILYLTLEEAKLSCLSGNDDLRLASLMTLVASQKSSSIPSNQDLCLLMDTLKFSLKSSRSDHKQRVMRVVCSVLASLSESSVQITKEKAKLAHIQKPGFDSAESLTNITGRLSKVLLLSERVLVWLKDEVLSGLYPGATLECEVMALELFRIIIENLENIKVFEVFMTKIYLSVEMTSSLLQCAANSTWDKSRELASELLLKFPSPLPGFSTKEQVNGLLAWAMKLVNNPRQRESEAGAFLLKVIMSKYSAALGWVFANESTSNENMVLAPADNCIEADRTTLAFVVRSFQFVSTLIDKVNDRTAILKSLFVVYQDKDGVSDASQESRNDIKFCHGLLHAVRLCLSDANNLYVASNIFEASSARVQVLERVTEVSLNCLKIAMIVVAEAKSDEVFSASSSVKGPINTATMAAKYVNANSYIGSMDETQDYEDKGSPSAQRAVVAAWLLVKESAATLAEIVRIYCLSPLDSFREQDVEAAGNSIVEALSRLKHMGAIAETQNSLQLISAQLLKLSGRVRLNSLPRVWLEGLLAKLVCTGNPQVFILRRSAGFAYSFLSILRGEASLETKPILLPHCMESLLGVVRRGVIESSHLDEWKMGVHALNVIRLIVQDSTFSGDISTKTNEFLASTLQLAMMGFKHSQWAVRNSSMLVFTSAVGKAVGGGDKNDLGGLASRATSFQDFFSRYPSLYSFFLEQLIESGNSTAPTPDPALYPILLLLASFRSIINSEDVHFDSSPYIAAVLPCLNHSSLLVRRMAGKALVAMQPVKNYVVGIEGFILQLINPKYSNHVHGILSAICEQLQILAEGSKSGSSSVVEKDFDLTQQIVLIADTLIRSLRNISLSLSDFLNCPVIRVTWLRLLTLLDDLSALTSSSREDSLAELLSQNYDHVLLRAQACTTSSVAPYEAEMFRTAIKCIVIKTQSNSISNLLRSVAVSPVSEIREGCFLGLVELQQTRMLSEEKAFQVLNILIHSLKTETFAPNRVLILQIMSKLIRELLNGSAELPELFTLFSEAVSRLGILRLDNAAPVALENLGYYARKAQRKLLHGCTDSSSYLKALTGWIALVDSSSREEQPEALRLAAAESLANSYFLSLSGPCEYCPQLNVLRLQSWVLCLRLLFDDDEGVREAMHRACDPENSKTIEYTVSVMSQHLASSIGEALSSTDAASLLDDIVPILSSGICFHLSSLSQRLMGQASSKVFEQELLNQFIEPVRVASTLLYSIQHSVESCQERAANLIRCVALAVLPSAETTLNRAMAMLDTRNFHTSTYNANIFPPLLLSLRCFRIMYDCCGSGGKNGLDGPLSSIFERIGMLARRLTESAVDSLHPYIGKELEMIKTNAFYC